jgi:hypothetical protein
LPLRFKHVKNSFKGRVDENDKDKFILNPQESAYTRKDHDPYNPGSSIKVVRRNSQILLPGVRSPILQYIQTPSCPVFLSENQPHSRKDNSQDCKIHSCFNCLNVSNIWKVLGHI